MSGSSNESYSLLPVVECAIHPRARVRFDYGDVDDLTESIRTMGQVQPGRAVRVSSSSPDTPKGVKYLVYVGCRRLLACKNAGLRHFKALVVSEIDGARIQRELLTENVKRSSLSALEELNLLANYSRSMYSLDDLASDLGLAPRFVRTRVKLAVLAQDKGLIEALHRIEQASGYRFTNTHVEKITAFEEGKWLPLSVQAAELNWRANDIEDLGREFTLESLVESLPGWGRSFVPGAAASETEGGAEGRPDDEDPGSEARNQARPGAEAQGGRSGGDDSSEAGVGESPSRYQTITDGGQFVVCPRCGAETVIEVSSPSSFSTLKLGRVQPDTNSVPVRREPFDLQVTFGFAKCSNEACGRVLMVAFDHGGDGIALLGRKNLLSIIGKGLEPEDGGRGSVLWDAKDETWLKRLKRRGGEESSYQGIDEQSRRWVVPVVLGKREAAVTTQVVN